MIITDNFCYFSLKPYVVTPHLNRLNKTVQMRGQNMFLCRINKKLSEAIKQVDFHSVVNRPREKLNSLELQVIEAETITVTVPTAMSLKTNIIYFIEYTLGHYWFYDPVMSLPI